MQKISPPSGIQSPDRTVRSESLLRLGYPCPQCLNNLRNRYVPEENKYRTSNLIKLQWICTKFRTRPSVRTTLYHENKQIFRKYLLINFFIQQREGKEAVITLHIIKAQRKVEVQLYSFLISTLRGGEWLTSSTIRFAHAKSTPGIQCVRRWAGSRNEQDTFETRKIYCPCWELNYESLVVQALAQSLSTPCYPRILFKPAQKYKFPPQTHNKTLILTLSSPVPLLASDTNIYAAGPPFCRQRHCQRYGLTVGKEGKRIENVKYSKHRCRQITQSTAREALKRSSNLIFCLNNLSSFVLPFRPLSHVGPDQLVK